MSFFAKVLSPFASQDYPPKLNTEVIQRRRMSFFAKVLSPFTSQDYPPKLNAKAIERRRMKKPGWVWKLYFLIFSAYIFFNMINLFFPEAFLYTYYHILIAFDPGYNFAYGLAVGKVIFNIISLIPFFLFVFQIRWLKSHLWQWVFALRIIFDLTGHGAEIKVFQSIAYINLQTLLSYLFIFLVLIVPSYIGCFWYAFQWKRMFSTNP